jgi:UDPglucose 6-dehydrogenase
MNIGIIGCGVVGAAIADGFEFIGHEVFRHDIKLDTDIAIVLETDLVFICVPTEISVETNGCDTSIVGSVIAQLNHRKYKGLVCIKSTVIPGTTEKLAKSFPNLRLAFVPEFLKARQAYEDFIEDHQVLIIGCHKRDDMELIRNAHKYLPFKDYWLSPTEAELSKYYSNVHNAMEITFANMMYEVCNKIGADYDGVYTALKARDNIPKHYLECRQDKRGFGGACLPKDTQAFNVFLHEIGLGKIELIKAILSDNRSYT